MSSRIAILILLGMTGLYAQSSTGEPDIRRRLEMVERGQGEAVKAELSQLMTTYQNNPGVMYLQGVLTTDGTEAAKIYQSVVDNFPKSEWADDALYRLYQYYTSVGLFKTAEQKMAQLKLEYPFSAYASEEEAPPAPAKPQTTQQQPPQAEQAPAEPVQQPAVLAPKGPVEKYPTVYTIQVGAFSTMANAEELKKRFEKEGYSSNIFTMTRDGKKLHKVWVGEFQNIDEARRFAGEVKKKFGLDAIVYSR
ncbi:MAG: hypothetical protein A3G43_10730 [Ignavibacteria bacterium RIFCSPLOWO2_12_FULL_56_21]|nr:MAG: hypothetical protein A2X68_07450 [Ignavibacteria bacterium GWC2_56_12]OGU71095.1 MAG: hypothetical protein A3G43_10730 [Ignavibacteria bacterium RIFCSPLOWO2_12_FULL_56_21]